METKDLFIRIDIEISDTQYSYNTKQQGKATVEFSATRDLLDVLDIGAFCQSSLKAALARFDNLAKDE